MDVRQLIALFRAEAKDQKLRYLWQDLELITYAGEAEYEAARRTRCRWCCWCTRALPPGRGCRSTCRSGRRRTRTVHLSRCLYG